MGKPGRPKGSRNKIKPPAIPSGEDPEVTIGNQANQIQLLINRCEELNHRLTDKTAEMALKRMEGWQDCAREILTTLLARDKT